MAASTRAAARLALLPADGLTNGVVAGLLGVRSDGLGAADFADGRGDSRDLDNGV
jgi:hypothetical protein